MTSSRFLRVLAAACLLAILFAGGMALWAWRAGGWDQWEEKTIRASLEKLRPVLPFEIERIEVRKNWRELFSGRISQVVLVLRKDRIRAELAGPLRVTRQADGDYQVEYLPETHLEWIGTGSLPSFPARLWLEVSHGLTRIRTAGLEAKGQDFKLAPLGIEMERPALRAQWQDGKARIEASLSSVKYQQEDRMAETKALALEAELPMTLQPFAIPESDTTIRGRFSGKSAEALWGERYFDVPLGNFPLEFALSYPIRKAELRMAPSGQRPILLGAELDGSASRVSRISWDLPPQSVPGLIAGALKSLPGLLSPATANQLAALQFKAGTIESRGQARLGAGGLAQLSGSLKLRELALRIPQASMALRGASLELQTDPRQGMQGNLGVRDLYYQGFHGRLGTTELRLSPLPKSRFDLRIGQERDLPLRVDGLDLRVGSVSGTLSLPFNFELQTSLSLPPTKLTSVLSPLCVESAKLPPSELSLAFPRIDFGPSWIEPSGRIRAELLGGFIQLSRMSLYDLGSEVPEVSFDARMEGIRLDRVGDWLRLGEIDGVLTGEATDVTFLSWLSTQYHARLEVKPLHKDKVIFSAKAMKNFLRLVGDNGIDHLPGLVDWYAFGWPRETFGGYNVEWLGVILDSENGFIQVRALENPEVFRREGKHFILYSHSLLSKIKMSVPGPNYPLIVSAPAMADYIHGRLEEYGLLEKNTQETDHETQTRCEPPSF